MEMVKGCQLPSDLEKTRSWYDLERQRLKLLQVRALVMPRGRGRTGAAVSCAGSSGGKGGGAGR